MTVKDLEKIISKEQMYKLYIEDNLTVQEVSDCIEGSNVNIVYRLIKKYEIKKDKKAIYSAPSRCKKISESLKGHSTSDEARQKMSDNNWLKRKTPEQEAKRLEKWRATHEKNKEINSKHNREAQLKRFADPQKHQDFIDKQRETKTKNNTLNPTWLMKQTHEQRVEACAKGVETKRRQGNLCGVFPIERKDEILEKSYNTKLKNGSLNSSNGANSKPNQLFESLLIEHNINYEKEFFISPLFYDFKIGDILVEIDPFATHNTTWNPFGNHEGIKKDYHFNKSKLATEHGYRCIHVWDWDDLDKIIFLLNDSSTIYARKCELKEVPTKESKEFLQKYHLQGYSKSTKDIGLYFNDELISIMTFGKPRYNKNYEWELIRYCSSTKVVGGAEKLFKYFVDNYNPESIVSYCDTSKFTGEVYTKLGFELVASNPPSKHWYNVKGNVHITDNLLRQRGYDQLFGTNYGKGTSNEQLMLEAGFVEIYDCGQARFAWTTK